MSLQDYFRPENVSVALDAYAAATSTDRLNWPIPRKLALYAFAKDAFDSNLGEQQRVQAFDLIYEELRSYWGVFRNPGGGYWDSATVYQTLVSACGPVSRSSMTLLSARPPRDEARVLGCLRLLRSLKQTTRYPHMAVAKFLHFFNPRLIPIYDGAVVWQSVLWGRPRRPGAFRSDYTQFCTRRQFRPREDSEQFNWNYLLLASELMNSTDTAALMRIFANWVREQADAGTDARVLDELETYYATAFEFIAIGAAERELTQRGASGV
ncbi:MAG: hypothetical protein ACK47B_01350 [Armatimonadota bacterium]